uniref:Uncharacterized protein n=1 Tax=Arundo donax TaxID=35708 RepID=A0A0A9ADF1_ARUDO
MKLTPDNMHWGSHSVSSQICNGYLS